MGITFLVLKAVVTDIMESFVMEVINRRGLVRWTAALGKGWDPVSR